MLPTGDLAAVGETVGRAFAEARNPQGFSPGVYHILPHGSRSWDHGETPFAGDTMEDRREILGRLAKVYLAIEGGPGTEHEARIVQSNSGVVMPIGRTGDFAGELFSVESCPQPRLVSAWRSLSDNAVTVEQVGVAAERIVSALLRKDA